MRRPCSTRSRGSCVRAASSTSSSPSSSSTTRIRSTAAGRPWSGRERELKRLGLQTVKSDFHIGPTVTIVTLLTYYGAMLFEGESRPAKAISTGVFLLLSILFYPFKYLDRFLQRKRSAHRLAFGVFCTSRKAPPLPAGG